MKQADIKKWLKEYNADSIYYSSHVREDKFETGKVKENDVRDNLLKPVNLIKVVEEESLYPTEYKYKLRFKLSGSKDLGIVVLLNEKIKFITAYMIEIKWQHRMDYIWKKK